MIFWAIVTIVLLIGNAVYCAVRIIADARSPQPANAVWGLFALAGVVSALAMMATAAGVAVSGI